MEKRFNIYTAIVYTSDKPHIGNTYEVILADTIARYKRLAGYQVYFQTGTDEHGQKIEKKAIENKLSTQEYVDSIALEIRKVWDSVNTSYDKFVRTTNHQHKEVVSQLFEKLYKQGDIYKGVYEGLYCTPCESFWTKNQLINEKCPDCGGEVEITKEEAYFFRLSKYEEKLKRHIKENPDFIIPECRKNEIVAQFLEPGLEDLCVSRTSFDWGIPVSFDNKHVIYVWIDALSNYITFTGYRPNGENEENFKKKWPADLHVVGKDIIRFHVIYWPIILLALGLELPKTIFGHPWVIIGSDKISKSKGTQVYADELVKKYGIDAVRFYLLSQIPFDNDGVFAEELLVEKLNAELANNLGNLLNRTLTMVNKYCQGRVPKVTLSEKNGLIFQEKVLNSGNNVILKLEKYYLAEAINETFKIFNYANKYIEESAPWELAKNNQKEKLDTVLYNLLEAIRHGAVLLQPFLPDTAENIFRQLNVHNNQLDSIKDFKGTEPGTKVVQGEVLFQKL